jgi:hypothetical protein
MNHLICFGFHNKLLIEANFNSKNAKKLIDKKILKRNQLKTQKETCKYCGGKNTEVLHCLGLKKRNAWEVGTIINTYFKINCLDCNKLYEFKPSDKKQAIKNAANKVPYMSYRYKKKYFIPLIKDFIKLKGKGMSKPIFKKQKKYLQNKICKHLEPYTPIKINNQIIIRGEKNVIKIFKSKETYNRYKNFLNY